MKNDLIESIVDEVVKRVNEEMCVPIEASGKHVHLSRADIDTLFGPGYELTKMRDLSQPGQYACKERVTLIGPKGALHNVVVLGPERKETQVEIALTDAVALGVKGIIKESGQLEGTPGIVIASATNMVQLQRGLIVAKRHIHMTPEDAKKHNVVNGETVQVKVFSNRPLIFDDVMIRVSPSYATFMHIDYDEANACGFTKGTMGKILKKST
ncbi:ethanolamine utilization phosphate acetyltransferase EutD [Brevibacillus laterosporus]|uniref:Phosphate propanoyltransferase n=2 Tax=Brevibacillus TaxID=55080 RepID=A0A0F6Y0T8_BRELA|nr:MULTISPECIES: ethanolamine utilization phosphate acetyltransferase EutD [Brevibacillus]AKF96101.1 propanediol utilization protein [Brevibacillus laterosporus]MCR8984939.1 ethanolamine utilization phosphate acetyltransferase EutD [Brevibacillus laterosporus]MCZ0830667.1 ethanolamine utilization phosphate acetyltransferase EutD [Brevibacillus halotolerans]MDN9009532.1 ethanolamine utilization phosphate acetyltransferase EutD [Brevibacillus laterosporus]MDO0940469.1 ethanolamine utilization ph